MHRPGSAVMTSFSRKQAFDQGLSSSGRDCAFFKGPALTKRRFSAIVLSWLGSGVGPVLGQPAAAPHSAMHLPASRSLPDELSVALRAGGPLVVMVSLEGCAYCRIVRENYLAPLARQGLAVVQVDWRSHAPLQDFAAAGTHDDAARRWKIKVAPTVLFFGPGGREVAPRLIGMSSEDFYGAYLDARLEQARRASRS